MRAIVFYGLATTAWLVFLNYDNLQVHRRLDALEHPATRSVAAATIAKPKPAGRTFRATNGVLLTPDDLSRIDAQDRETDKWVAELEYSWSKHSSKRK